ncbi:MAG: DUF1579 family protein [Thermoguttaceae bacterium]|jgi:hypothetical protein
MKRMATITVLLAAAGSLAAPCRGQEPGPSYEHIKFLEPLVGNWKLVLKEGGRIVSNGQERSEWILNKSFMRQVGWGQIDGQPVQYEFWNGWNPKTQEVFQWAVGATDTGYAIIVRTGAFDPARRVLTAQDRTIGSDGRENTAKVDLQLADQNSYTMAFTERRTDNVAAPDQHSSYSRAPAVAAPPLDATPGPGYEHLKFLDFSVGKWKMEGDLPDGRYLGEEVKEWVFDKNFIHTKGWGKPGDKDRIDYELLTGWDPAKKKVFIWFVGSDGSVGTREGTYDAAKNRLISSSTAVDASGVESAATVEEQYIDKNRFLMQFTNGTRGGRPQPDVEGTATRIGP